jgi:hypothetical protein
MGVNQTVVEHTHALVHPQPSEHLSAGALFRGDHKNALEHFRHVAQVERVMALRRRRLHVVANPVKHLDRRSHDLLR